MKQAPEVRFVGMEPSEALAAAVLDKSAKLDRFHPSIMSCHATVELAHKHRRQGRPFAVHLEVGLPSHDLTVNRVEHEDPYVAVRDAFDDMKRRLEDKVRRLRGEERHREVPAGAAELDISGSLT
jgi:ribosomal subunit interface protein